MNTRTTVHHETAARITPSGAAAPHPRRWAALAVLSASLLLIVMDVTILNVALPAISADLRPDASACSGWSTSTRWWSPGCWSR